MERRHSIECRHHHHQQLIDCDIVKRGTLYVKHPPSSLPAAFTIQPWKKRYVVLRDTWYCSPCVVTSLDIYNSEPASLETGLDCRADSDSSGARSFLATVGRHQPYSVDLRQVSAVGFHLDSRRFQFAFYVERCDDRPLLFAAESDLEMRCWVAALRMLAEKAHQGMNTSPDIRRCSSTASPASPTRRCTVPSIDVGVPFSLDERRRNLSDPQLHAVSNVLYHRSASSSRSGQQLVDLQRKLTPADINGRHRSSPTSAMSSLNEVVPTHSLDGAAAADGHHPLRRMFSTSVLGSLLRRDIGSRRKALSRFQRKDSGFSDSFDESTCDSDLSTHPHGQDSPDSVSPPPTPPPRPPPRRTTVVNTSTPPTPRHPAPPPPAVTAEHGDVDRPEPSPPTPPPRPPHTLLASCSMSFH